MTDPEQIEKKMAIWRTKDGLIGVVLPPTALAITVLSLGPNHLEAVCPLINSLAFHVNRELLAEAGLGEPSLVTAIETMLDRMRERHGIAAYEEGAIFKGDAETFEGHYYGEIHPFELAAMGFLCEEFLETFPGNLEEIAPATARSMQIWASSSRRFVTDSERLALLGKAGTA
jgi:hypothetical protein